MSKDFEVNEIGLFLFPTRVSIFKTNVDTDNVYKTITLLKETVESVNLSNVGGWQSPDRLIEEDERFKEVFDVQDKCLNQYLRTYNEVNYYLDNSWANINNGTSFNRVHIHPGSQLSGCLYIKVPGGTIEFHDPRVRASMEIHRYETCPENYGVYTVAPEEGDFIVFPSWLEHRVNPSNCTEDRASVASNYAVTLV
jgi:uncharacterized protein (TIGR02466 family)